MRTSTTDTSTISGDVPHTSSRSRDGFGRVFKGLGIQGFGDIGCGVWGWGVGLGGLGVGRLRREFYQVLLILMLANRVAKNPPN